MHVLALCAGAGGLELGLNLAEPTAKLVCAVEGEAYVASLLVAHMEAGRLDTAPIWSDVRTFDGQPWRGKIDCITAGYPCQPFSIAGRKRADQDPRHLWPHVARIVREIQPQWCFFENVSHHLSLGFEQVCHDLGNMGYAVAAGLFSAPACVCTQNKKLWVRLPPKEKSPREGLGSFQVIKTYLSSNILFIWSSIEFDALPILGHC